MKYIKSLLAIIVISLLISPPTAHAAFAVGWSATSTATSWISPNLVNGVEQSVRATQFIATSTSLASYFNLVGIGTTTPFATLAVNPTAGTALNQFVVGSSTGTSLIVKNSGNVGIGTTSPYTKLSVVGDIVASAITATSTFDTSGITGGYKIDGNLILQASSTNMSTLLGQSAGEALLSDGTQNTAIGYQALKFSTSTDANTAVGHRSLYLTTVGTNNTGNGAYTLYSNTSGSQNTGIGRSALYANISGNNNTAVGYNSLFSNTTGSQNIAFGGTALQANTTGTNNTALGYASLYTNSTGTGNTASGMYSLYYSTTSTYSTAVGYLSGVGTSLTTSDYNSKTDTFMTFLGTSASRDNNNASTTLLTNSTAIGYNAKVGGSNMLVLGNGVNVGIGTSTPNRKLTVSSAGGETSTSLMNIEQTAAAVGNAWMNFSINNTYSYAVGALRSGNFQIGYNATGPSGLAINPRLTIDTTGNVGIGTTSPFAKLSITGGGTASSTAFAISNSSNATTFEILDRGNVQMQPTTVIASGLGYGSRSSAGHGVLELYSAQTGDTTIRNNFADIILSPKGGVGIGTTSPQTPLSISAGLISVAQLKPVITMGGLHGAASGGTSIDFAVNGLSNPMARIGSVIGNTTSDGDLVFYTTTSYSSVAPTEKLRISGAGLVGIGTTTPTTELQLASTLPEFTITDTDAGTNAKHWYMENNSGVLSFGTTSDALVKTATKALSITNGGFVGIGSTTPYARLSVTNTGTGPSFVVEDSTSGDATPFVVDASGRVGIGSTSPSGVLSVEGSVFLNGLTSSTAGNAVCQLTGGEIVNAGNTTCVTSSKRFKTDIEDIDVGLKEVLAMKPRSYTRTQPTPSMPSGKEVGLIAEEVSEIVPRLVEYEADGVTPRGVNYQEYTAVLTKAIQEQQKQIDELKAMQGVMPQSESKKYQVILTMILVAGSAFLIGKLTNTLKK